MEQYVYVLTWDVLGIGEHKVYGVYDSYNKALRLIKHLSSNITIASNTKRIDEDVWDIEIRSTRTDGVWKFEITKQVVL